MPEYKILAKYVLDAFTSGDEFPETTAKELLQLVEQGMNEAEKIDVVVTLAPLIYKCNFAEYQWYCDELAKKQQDIISPCFAKNDTEVIEKKPKITEEQYLEADAFLTASAKERPILVNQLKKYSDDFAEHFGADKRLIEEIAHTVVNGAKLNPQAPNRFPILPRILVEGLFPKYPDLKPYNHAVHTFAHALLSTVGADIRWHPSVVRLLGEQLESLFNDEQKERKQHFVLSQAAYLVDEYLANHPCDIIAITWMAQLEAVKDNFDRAYDLANRIIGNLKDLSANGYYSLISFITTFDGSDLSDFLRGEYRLSKYDTDIGRLTNKWFDKEEELATALIKKALSTNNWTPELAVFVLEWSSRTEEIELPPEAWISAAYYALSILCHQHDYYFVAVYYFLAWEYALKSALASNKGDYVIFVAPYVIAHNIINSEEPMPLAEVLHSFTKISNTQHLRRKAADIIQRVDDQLNNGEFEWGTAEDKLALIHAKEEFSDEIHALSQRRPDPMTKQEIETCRRNENSQQAEECVGETCWKSLKKINKSRLIQAIDNQQQLQHAEGDDGDFGIPIIIIEKVVIDEFTVNIRSITLKHKELRRDYGEYTKIFQITEFIQGISKPDAQEKQRKFLASGMDIPKLCQLENELDELRQARNRSAHHRIDREEAAVIYGKWMNKGLLRKYLQAIHTRRAGDNAGLD